MRFRTTRDVRLDVLVARLMGTTSGGAVEAFLAANPGLSALGAEVRLGTEVDVPVLEPQAPAGHVRAWE